MPKNNICDPITDQEIVEQDTDGQRRFHLSREQVLTRLWEIAKMSPETTRNTLTGQVKALSMIVAIEGLIPDRRASSAQNKPVPDPVTTKIHEPAWPCTRQPGENADPEPPPPPAQEETAPLTSPSTTSPVPRVPTADHFAPDTRVPFSIKRNPFARRR